MKDRFSNHARQYAAFRPTYPRELYDFILSLTPGRHVAWDCATGSGQVARDLAPHFEKVFATDISATQLQHATQLANVEYAVCAAEKTPFSDSLFDVITVGQAIHWIDRRVFYKEAMRVAKPGAALAVWGYGLLTINQDMDALIRDFYVNVIGPYWDKERRLVDEQYRTISFPFEEIQPPTFTLSFEWSLDELAGYLSTWSSVQKYVQINGLNPVDDLVRRLGHIWPAEKMQISFPLFMRCGIVAK